MSFEVVMDGPDKNALARPPPRLAKLERRKKKKKELSAEEIKEKLEKAEKRRKVNIQLIINNIFLHIVLSIEVINALSIIPKL